MKLIYCVVICFIYTGIHAQPANLLHKPYSVQYVFLDSFLKTLDPLVIAETEAVNRVNELVKWSENNKDEALANELMLLKFTSIARKKENVHLEQELIDLLEKAKAENDHYLEANVLNALGDYWVSERKHGLAFEYYLASYNIYFRLTPEEFPVKKRYLLHFGNTYMQYGDYDNAIKLFNDANKIKEITGEFTYSINNAIGMYYRRSGKYDSAELYFQDIYVAAVKNKDPQWIGISSGNIGICCYYRKEYDKAIPLLEKDIETSLVSHQLQNAINSMYILADIYFIRHNNAKSEQLLMRALATGECRPFWPKYQLAEPIFELLSKINAARNDMRAAYLYADSAMIAKDSVTAQYNALNVAKAEEKMELVQSQANAKQLDNERKVQMLIRNGLVTGILLLAVIGILFINRQRLIQKKLIIEKGKAEVERKNAESELGMAVRSLDNFRQSIQEKNTIIDSFINEIDQIKQGIVQQIDNETLIKLQQSTILTDEQWEDFRILFEKVHKGFFNRIREKMPDLTPGEIRFVALSKLKLSPKEMSSILGISSSTIRNYRLRLRRKLDLDEDASIEDIAGAI